MQAHHSFYSHAGPNSPGPTSLQSVRGVRILCRLSGGVEGLVKHRSGQWMRASLEEVDFLIQCNKGRHFKQSEVASPVVRAKGMAVLEQQAGGLLTMNSRQGLHCG